MSSLSGSEASDSESDIEMQSALPALKKPSSKTPKSPSEELLNKNQDAKKMSTKEMIREALTEQKSRKGISLHAIRKFIVEKHTVNVDRITSLIKKGLKAGIEEGFIVQTKGIGASGSFKLAPKKKPEPTEKKKKVVKSKTSEKTDKAKKTKKEVEKKENGEKKVTKKKVEDKTSKLAKKVKPENKEKSEKGDVKEKKAKSKMAKEKQTPAKKRANMMKRKSIGSIIKAPKMKPKRT
ncbi:hypothetical protein ABMA27_011081 [Loxostege sticticalis]|uniref:H15 domain-containing protein n=1 Tax=Loxostege sticticalis TaxID=481309 RepID=A0ABR3H386_LOXSC